MLKFVLRNAHQQGTDWGERWKARIAGIFIQTEDELVMFSLHTNIAMWIVIR